MTTATRVVIVGGGPAGLTAALELQTAGIRDITVIEADHQVGGISRTVEHHGNRIDIGGHRFFSKSDWVMDWWRGMMPVAAPADPDGARELRYQGAVAGAPAGTASEADEDVMLLRSRLSRIYFNKQFFDYPLKLNPDTLLKLGPWKTFTFGLSYMWARVNPRRPEASLEDFLVNRFGRKLYGQFFKEYTEKVWGVPCGEISAAWGAQRIKSLSITKAVMHAVKQVLGMGGKAQQTSLIESFLYPKYGPGQMWETAARRFVEQGGTLLMRSRVERIDIADGRVQGLAYRDADGIEHALPCTHLLSTMPIKDLVQASAAAWPEDVRTIAGALSYRDFITVGLLYPRSAIPRQLDDNWIYIQEPGVKVGRIQNFKAWSPEMVPDPKTNCYGLEYFCFEGDGLWSAKDEDLIELAKKELEQLGLGKARDVFDGCVVRQPKAYPVYDDQYAENVEAVRVGLEKSYPGLHLVGRNGMHRYNNSDHSMMTAMLTVENIVAGTAKFDPWRVNQDAQYIESGTAGEEKLVEAGGRQIPRRV